MSDSFSDKHIPSLMLQLIYSSPQAAGALIGPSYRPMTTQQYLPNEPRIEEGFSRSTWPRADPNRSRMMDAVEWTAIGGSRVRRVLVLDFKFNCGT